MKHSKNTLYCFSPPIMLITFALELVFAIIVLMRYMPSKIRNVIVTALTLLAVFQLSEYFVCGGVALSALAWSRVGFVTISLLPVLGFYALTLVVKKPYRSILYTLTLLTAVAVGYFALASTSVSMAFCGKNYAIFELAQWAQEIYNPLYVVALLISVGVAFYERTRASKKLRSVLNWFIIGYAVFIIPTIAIFIVAPSMEFGLPSIMCGFAIVYAVILLVKIVPAVCKPKK